MLQITAIMISNIMLRSIRSSYTYSVIKVYCIVCYVCHANFKQKKQPNEYDAFFFHSKRHLLTRLHHSVFYVDTQQDIFSDFLMKKQTNSIQTNYEENGGL